jgi:hemolysin III
MRCCREPVSGFTHLAGAILSVGGLIVLVVATDGNPAKMISMIIYGMSMILLYAASATLHLVQAPQRAMLWFKRFDHAAIYALIAGTYTPFCYNLLDGRWRWGLLGTVWALAVVSMFFKLAFHTHSSGWGTLIYIGMGWLGVIAAPEIVRALPPRGIGLVLGGGLAYSLGVLLYSLDDPHHRPRYFNYHDAWHLLVMAGSALHFTAVLMYVAR